MLINILGETARIEIGCKLLKLEKLVKENNKKTSLTLYNFIFYGKVNFPV